MDEPQGENEGGTRGPLYSGFPGFPLGFLVCFCPGGLMADLIEDSLSLKPSGPYPVLNHIR